MPGPLVYAGPRPRQCQNAGVSTTLLAALPTQFTNDLATLRLIGLDDWPVEVALAAQPDVVRWTRYPPELDEAGARARIRDRIDWALARKGGRYIVIDPAGAIAGNAGIAMNDQQTPEIFYALLPSGRGRGLAAAAARQLSDWALNAGHGVVALKTVTGNAASELVARRAGFHPVGAETGVIRGSEVQLQRWHKAKGGMGLGMIAHVSVACGWEPRKDLKTV